MLPKEYRQTKKAWIEGIKACSSDSDFLINLFFEENEQELNRRIEEEKAEVSGILTQEDCREGAEDLFRQGYEAAKEKAGQGRPIRRRREKKELKVGLALYNGEDTFVKTLSEDIKAALQKLEQEEDIRVLLLEENAEGRQQRQNQQLSYLMQQECDVLVVNPVDTGSASKIIHRAKEQDIPLVFFNREPLDEDICLWNQVYYVGTDGEEIGALQGEILSRALRENPQFIDKNRDGVLQYVLIEGEAGHRDSVKRTEAILKKAEENFPAEQIAVVFGNWERETAGEEFMRLGQEKTEACEAVISHNDDMALGVFEALEQNGVSSLPAFIGVNGSREVLEKIQEGVFLGTVSQESEKQAEKIVDLAWKLWERAEIGEPQKIYLPGEKQEKTAEK